MFGIEEVEIYLLIKQLGFALAGAAALWGFVFSIKDFDCGKRECIIYDWISRRLLPLLVGGTILGYIGYELSSNIALAHEGIVVVPGLSEITAGLSLVYPVVFITVILVLIGAFLRFSRPKKFDRIMTPFYALAFVLFFFLTAVSAWTGEFSADQLFFFGHGFHSIFTLGTVLVLDYLFLVSKKSRLLQSHIFPTFPTISKVIWVGLAIDFLSALLILDQFVVSDKFFFMQTVIGIIIINGVFLSGPIARKMLSQTSSEHSLQGKWHWAANFAGTVSVSSWLTITVVDFFAHLTLSYHELLMAYAGLIAVVFVLHEIVEYIERRHEPPAFAH